MPTDLGAKETAQERFGHCWQPHAAVFPAKLWGYVLDQADAPPARVQSATMYSPCEAPD
jgi:hypothetical protein